MARQKQENYNSIIADCLAKKHGVRSVLYNKYFYDLSQSVDAALFLSQLLYWWGKGQKPGWIYKTIHEIREETGLTKNKQARAIAFWEKGGVIETKLEGMPPKRHFKINIDVLVKLLEIEDIYAENMKKLSRS